MNLSLVVVSDLSQSKRSSVLPQKNLSVTKVDLRDSGVVTKQTFKWSTTYEMSLTEVMICHISKRSSDLSQMNLTLIEVDSSDSGDQVVTDWSRVMKDRVNFQQNEVVTHWSRVMKERVNFQVVYPKWSRRSLKSSD